MTRLSSTRLDALRAGIDGQNTAVVSLLLYGLDQCCDGDTIDAYIDAVLDADAGGVADDSQIIPMAIAFREAAKSVFFMPPTHNQEDLDRAQALLATLGYTVDLPGIYTRMMGDARARSEGAGLLTLVNNGDTPADLIAPYPEEAPPGRVREIWLDRLKRQGRQDIIAWHDDVLARHDDGKDVILTLLHDRKWDTL